MRILVYFLDPARQWKVLPLLMFIFYVFIPFTIYGFAPSPYLLTCGMVGLVSIFSLLLGGLLVRRKGHIAAQEQQRPNKLLVVAMGLLFSIFVMFVVMTASSIPILDALTGAGSEVVAAARADFLKSRTGWEGALVYINALFAGFVFPYLIVKLYYVRHKYFWPIVLVFSSYSLLSTEKALFLRWALPLLIVMLMLASAGSNKHQRLAKIMVVGTIALFFVNSLITGFTGGGAALKILDSTSLTDFFTAGYYGLLNQGSTLVFLLWRTFAVPTFSAVDSFRTFHDIFHDHLLFGATSGTLATMFDLPRIWFEREVFAGEWGQSVGGTNSSNAVFFVEAFVNFGWLGVVGFSLMAGYVLSSMGRSRDVGILALAPMLTLCLFTSGFLGIIFGNGLLLLPFMSWLHMRRNRGRTEICARSSSSRAADEGTDG